MKTDKRQKKMEITSEISEKIEQAKSLIITDYRGLNTAQLLELRQKLVGVKAEYQIVKNTLVKRALRSKGMTVRDESLSGPTALLFSYEDEITPIKSLIQYIRTTQLPIIKSGYFGKDAISGKQVESLAKLPSKDQLIGQVVGTLNAPIQGVVNVLQANIRNLVYVLSAAKDKQNM